MNRAKHMIGSIDPANLDAFGQYLEDHLKDNGRDETPLFQPPSAAVGGLVAEKIASFRIGKTIPVGDSGWRRGWVSSDGNGAIVGHVDLRAHVDPCTGQRALLGMGVHRGHRGRGLGRALVAFAVAWATHETLLDWIDLQVLADNAAAEHLYRSVGFHEIATVEDMFRIGGRSVHNILMTKRLRP